MRRGAMRILILFLLTIAIAVMAHSYLSLPPVLGMLTGLGFLQIFSYYLKVTGEKSFDAKTKGDLSNPRAL